MARSSSASKTPKGLDPTKTWFRVKDLILDATNPREAYTGPEQDKVGDSMLANGQIVGIVARTLKEGDKVVDGHLRVRQAMRVGIEWVHGTSKKMTDAEEAAIQADANLQRVDLTPREEALAYQKLLKNGHTMEQVCKRYGLTRNTLKARLAILTVPEDLGRLVKRGRGGFTIQHAQCLKPLDGRAVNWPGRTVPLMEEAAHYVRAAQENDDLPVVSAFPLRIAEHLAGLGLVRLVSPPDTDADYEDLEPVRLGAGVQDATEVCLYEAIPDFDARREELHAKRRKAKPTAEPKRASSKVREYQLSVIASRLQHTNKGDYGPDFSHAIERRYLMRLGLIAGRKEQRDILEQALGLPWTGRGDELVQHCHRHGWDSLEAKRILHAAYFFEAAGDDEVPDEDAPILLGASPSQIRKNAERNDIDQVISKTCFKCNSPASKQRYGQSVCTAKACQDAAYLKPDWTNAEVTSLADYAKKLGSTIKDTRRVYEARVDAGLIADPEHWAKIHPARKQAPELLKELTNSKTKPVASKVLVTAKPAGSPPPTPTEQAKLEPSTLTPTSTDLDGAVAGLAALRSRARKEAR